MVWFQSELQKVSQLYNINFITCMELQKFILRDLAPKTFTLTSEGLEQNKSEEIPVETMVFYNALD